MRWRHSCSRPRGETKYIWDQRMGIYYRPRWSLSLSHTLFLCPLMVFYSNDQGKSMNPVGMYIFFVNYVICILHFGNNTPGSHKNNSYYRIQINAPFWKMSLPCAVYCYRVKAVYQTVLGKPMCHILYLIHFLFRSSPSANYNNWPHFMTLLWWHF